MFKVRMLSLFAVAAIVSTSLSSCVLTVPVAATSNPIGTKVGTSSGMGLLHIIRLSPDSGIQQAAKNGGITKISTVDFKQTDILGIFQTYTCTITGE